MAHDKDGNVVGKKGASRGNGGKRSKYRNSGGDGPVRWDSVDSVALLAAVDAVTEAGDAIVLARTSDGGVLSITVCSGPERVKFYPKDGLDATRTLLDISKAAGGEADAF
jgi:hypothetical protein